jgi:hypothetical protein
MTAMGGEDDALARSTCSASDSPPRPPGPLTTRNHGSTYDGRAEAVAEAVRAT